MQLLLIEDDPAIVSFLRQGLSESGHQIRHAASAEEAEPLLARESFDVVVLDVMLPRMGGVEFCRALRRRGTTTPILMLTALSSTGDKVRGLDAGADDYLPKPFEFDELLARLKALTRRHQSDEPTVFRCRDLEMDLLRRQVTRAGKKIRLTAKEFALLEYLLRSAGRVLSRAQIAETVWQMDLEFGGNVIEVYVSTLRRKIDKGFEPPLIHTVVGVGYVLTDEPPAG